MARFRLVRTCFACPEQYDVFEGNRQVGYLRLRHGSFRVIAGDSGGDTIAMFYPNGNGLFDSNERDEFLTKACKVLAKEGDCSYEVEDACAVGE